MLGFLETTESKRILNLIFIAQKFYIYKSKANIFVLNFQGMKQVIQDLYLVEFQSAFINGNWERLQVNWQPGQHLLAQ